jgi:phenylalanyl-tRNA synthetase beta chain
MENPLSEEAALLRPTLVPGMVTMLAHNLNRDVREVRLFEQGTVFTGTTDAVHEAQSLSLGLTGAVAASSLHTAADAPFFELKGVVESLLSIFEHSGLSFTADAPKWLEPGRAASASVGGRVVAWFGELRQSEREARKLRQPVYLAELALRQVTASDLSRFQAVERDFSFVFGDAMQWKTIADAIEALAIPELQRLSPVEIFRDPKGNAMPAGTHALLLRCVFQSYERTLQEDEIAGWSSAIIAALTKLGGTIRAGQ